MSNDFYNNSSDPADNTDATPDVLRAEHASIAAGFAKLAGLSGNGSKVVRVNAGATAYEAVDVSTLGAQPLDTDLTAIAALTSAANKRIHATGSGTWSVDGAVTARSSNTIIGVADYGTTFVGTGTYTQTFSAAATLGAAWYCGYRNDGTGVITLSSSTIDGAASINLYPGESCLIFCDASNLKTIGRATGWVELATQTASTSATIDYTANSSGPGFDDTFDRYIDVFDNAKPATDDVYMHLRIGTGVTPTFQSGAASYTWGLMNAGPGGAGAGDGTTASFATGIALGMTAGGLGVGNASGEYISGIVEYTNPELTTDFCVFSYRTWGVRSDEVAFAHSGSGYWKTVGAITGMRYAFSSGAIASGTWRRYGLRK